ALAVACVTGKKQELAVTAEPVNDILRLCPRNGRLKQLSLDTCQPLGSDGSDPLDHRRRPRIRDPPQTVLGKSGLDRRCVKTHAKVLLNEIAQTHGRKPAHGPFQRQSGERSVHVVDVSLIRPFEPEPTKNGPGNLSGPKNGGGGQLVERRL